MVTHDHDEAYAVADRLVVMRSGRVVQEGEIADVWAHPVDPDTALFLGYARVLVGPAAATVLAAAHLAAAPAVAMRRSALVVSDEGVLSGVVITEQATPDQVRLVVDVEGVGEVDAVGASDHLPVPGERVRLALDPGRMAVIR
jgi:thiamine transport system ATP-binding protein